jgi:hypothetical protein
VEDPAPAPTETPAPAPAEDDAAPKPAKTGVQARIDELVRARGEAERQAAYWQQIATQGTAPNPASPAASKTQPTPEQFSDYGQYITKLAEWSAEQAVAARMSEGSVRAVEDLQAETFQARQTQIKEVLTDYDAVVGASKVPVKAHVLQALLSSERGPELTYHLAKNPEVLDRLNALDVRAADREIGKLEGSLAPASPPVKKIASNAPTPPGVGGSGGRSATPDPGAMSMQEYVAHRAKQGATWVRR